MWDARVEPQCTEGWSMLTSTEPKLSAERRAMYWADRAREANLLTAKLRREIAELRLANARLERRLYAGS